MQDPKLRYQKLVDKSIDLALRAQEIAIEQEIVMREMAAYSPGRRLILVQGALAHGNALTNADHPKNSVKPVLIRL